MNKTSGRISAPVSAEFFELSKAYLAKRQNEISHLHQALERGAFDEIRAMSHKTKGTAASYGLKRLGELAHELELHSKNRDTSGVRAVLDQIESFLNQVEITLAK